ncbi:MAG: serine/threonine-protein kinase [Planctomycetota bacterium]|nr:serine/threonine-protein kinase [Planctomycetota bacterium]
MPADLQPPTPGPDDEILSEAVRLGLLTSDQADECRKIRDAMRGMGLAPRSLDEIAAEKGYLGSEEIDRLRASPPRPAPATEVSVRGYRLLGLLEENERESTYQALREDSGERCALRVLKLDAVSDSVRAFCEEARRLTRLSHPNLLSGIEAGLEGPPYFVAVQWAAGEVLGSVLRERGSLEESRAVEIVRDVARALESIHLAGLVHGGVHPRRILIPRAGSAKLMPLGAIVASETLSPEQVLGEALPGPASDLYSLGATFYCLLTGRAPFAGETSEEVMAKQLVESAPPVRALAPDVSEGAEEIVLKLLEKSPSDRYPDAGALLADLEGLISAPDLPAATAATALPTPPRRAAPAAGPVLPSHPGRRWTVVISVALMILVVGLGVFALSGRGRRKGRQVLPLAGPRQPERPRSDRRPTRQAPPAEEPTLIAIRKRPDVVETPTILNSSEDTGEDESVEVEEVAATSVPAVEPQVDRMAFLQAFLADVAGYRFDSAAQLCERRVGLGESASLEQSALRALTEVRAVVRRANEAIVRDEGRRRSIRLRDGLRLEGTIIKGSSGRVAVKTDDGLIEVPMRFVSAGDLLALAEVDDPLAVGLVRLLLYGDAVGAEKAFGALAPDKVEPFLALIDPLAFQALLERADVFYGRKEWRRSLEAYLDLLGRFPRADLFGADPGWIRERVYNGILLGRIGGSFHTEVEVDGGFLSFAYRLRDPREWEDWTGLQGRQLSMGTLSWRGRLSGNLIVEWSIQSGEKPCWIEFHADPDRGTGYRIMGGEWGWRLVKETGKGKAEDLGKPAFTFGAVSLRIERVGDLIRVYRDRDQEPFLVGRDGSYGEGIIRMGGDLSRLERIRIRGRLAAPGQR